MALACFPVYAVGLTFPATVFDRLDLVLPWGLRSVVVGLGLLALLLALQLSPAGMSFVDDVPPFGWAHLMTSFCGPKEVALLWIRGLFKNLLELTKGLIFIFCCCPRKRVPLLSHVGRHTIYPYMLHLYAREIWSDAVGGRTGLLQRVFEVSLLPVLVAVLLASAPVRWVFGPILEPLWLERLLGSRTPMTRDVTAGSYGDPKAVRHSE
eukprot:CAMPEP_0204594820 /NCGR_PEP_ID=MMETSP0661-20131031/52301_1 /ASSEMBLY_ACC=CAM_ASM_000606 /TAXON_ID=109239 /ORGANISM="Alexandrium margalefi, Strain AMGDE01CS-322" /LENGTH=208 /DNA_ID=CAMNT_0051605261 /DNA_START=13 /DNA_END=639 /DNA_ORIENTATION=-